jgi:hypothetical protein
MARTPRTRHLRHREHDRVEHSRHLREFLSERATALSGTGASTTFTVSSQVISASSHGHAVGDGPFVAGTTGDAVLPSGLIDGELYWIATAPDANTFTLTSVLGGDPVDLVDDGTPGSGTFTIAKAEDDEAIFEYLRQNAPEVVRDATDADSL